MFEKAFNSPVRDFPDDPVIKKHTSTSVALGLIPSGGNKIPQAMQKSFDINKND